MNTHVQIDQYAAWRHALKTNTPVPFEPGNPASGFYKVRDRNPDRSIRWDVVAVWRDDDGLQCSRTGPRPAPTHFDEIEALFAICNSTPITHELFQHIFGGGTWPDEVETPAVEAKPDAAPHEALKAELTALRDQASAWIKAIGAVKTKDDADKAANYADAFAKLERRATELHKSEKAPHLEAGRAVDAAWKPTIDGADVAKKWAKGLSVDFARAENARRAEEARAANEKAQREYALAKAQADEQARRDAELAAKGVQVPQFAPLVAIEPPKAIVAEPVKIGTGGRRQSLRRVESYEIEDAGALLTFLANRNLKSEKLLAVALSDGRALREVGVEVPGLKLVVTEEVR